MITEAYTNLKNTMRYYGNETNLGAHLPFNFGLINNLNDQSNATNFNYAVNSWLENMPKGKSANWVVITIHKSDCRIVAAYQSDHSLFFQIGNHDNPRVATRFGSEMVDAMNMLNLLLPGSTFTYMGEEIGMEDTNVRWDQTVDPRGLNAGQDGYRILSRDPARSPFQWDASVNSGFSSNSTTWLPVNPNYWRLNLDTQKKGNWSHYSVYKRLTKLKKTRAIQHGTFGGYVLSKWVYAFSRYGNVNI